MTQLLLGKDIYVSPNGNNTGDGSGVTVLAPAARAVEKLTLKVVKVDSEETAGEDGKGANAVDGNPNTIWLTQWLDASPAHPHEIILRLDPPCKIKGLTYLPRQYWNDNGTIEGYEIYVSTDGKDFGQPVKKGELFPYGKDKKTVLFDPKQCGFVKLVALSEVNGQPWTTAAEIGVIQETEQVVLEESVIIRSGLALAAPLLSISETVLRRDPLEAQLVAGTFVAPKDGSTVPPFPLADPALAEPARTWTAVTASAGGVFRGGKSTIADGWLYATVDSVTDRVMLLEAYGHHSVFVNGDPRGGNWIMYDLVGIPVKLKAGSNNFLFAHRGSPLAARLVPPPAAVFISDRDILAPSLVAGHDTDGPAGVVVVNASMEPLSGARIRIASDLPEKDAWVDLGFMPALTPKKVALPARSTSSTAGAAGAKHSAQVTLTASDGTVLDTLTVDLATVSSTDRRVVTRVSTIDDSVQYYALVPSTANREDSAPIPGILFSLHGNNTEATTVAEDFAPKKEAHIVCPTNRRPRGFFWDDWGCIDFTEAVAHARASLVNDPRRSWLTGHSMGGHGTWLLGARFPSEFAAIAPTAAFIDHSPRGPTSADTAPAGYSAAAMHVLMGRANDIRSIKENYLQQGVYVLHGEADEDVSVSHAREMFKQLAAISHPDFQYYERPASPHWWSTAHDWPPKLQFLFRHVLPEPNAITRVRFRTWAPQVSCRNAWVRILQQDKPFEVSSVDVSLDVATRTIIGTTSNVITLELEPPIALPAAAATADITVTLDGHSTTMTPKTDTPHLRFRREEGPQDKTVWRLDPSCRNGSEPAPMPSGEKTPARGGLFKMAFTNRFVVVVGTQGDEAADALLMAKVRYDADQWWVRGNGRFEIIPDAAFDPQQYRKRNVILYGNHDQNAAWSKVLGDGPPVDVRDGVFTGPTSRHQGDDIAVMFVYPRADCGQSQIGVVAATGAKGIRAGMRTSVVPITARFPDLVAFRAAMLTEGAASVIEAGFFGNDWSIERGTWIRR